MKVKRKHQPNKIKTADLPEEIIRDILLRLPVKSLLKSRSVSKSWLSLISSPQFVKAHLKFSSRNTALTDQRVMITYTSHFGGITGFKQCPISSMMSKGPILASEVDYPHNDPYVNVVVVGSCNGIICLVIDNDYLYLWNPSTRKSKAQFLLDVKMDDDFYYPMWGFGYNESKDDYKVVAIFFDYGNESGPSKVKVYSLREDSWKVIGDFSYGFPSRFAAMFASGKVHFATTSSIPERSRLDIVSLDLMTEAYSIVEQPNYGESCFESYFRMVGGCLSILRDFHGTRVDMWVMKEHGVKESWTRVVSIPYSSEIADMVLYSNLLWIMPSGEILLVCGESLALYNPKGKSFNHVRICNFCDFVDSYNYIESLVPL